MEAIMRLFQVSSLQFNHNKARSVTAVIWLAVGLSLGSGASALAQMLGPEGDFSGGFGSLEWHSQCSKPLFPSLSSADESEVEFAKTEFSSYQDCLIRRASADSRYASQAVIEAAKKELESVEEDGELAGWHFN
jgi:hypothetical protein